MWSCFENGRPFDYLPASEVRLDGRELRKQDGDDDGCTPKDLRFKSGEDTGLKKMQLGNASMSI